MKKKILFLIALLVVILSFGYGVKADTCTYQDSMFPSQYFESMKNYVCEVIYKENKAACKYTATGLGKQIDKDCYCTKVKQNGAGDECYKAGLLNLMEKQTWGKTIGQATGDETKNKHEAAMDSACKAIAGCFAGTNGGSPEQQIYNNTYSNCMATNVNCDTFTTCGNKLCETTYKGNVFCETSIDSENFCKLKENSNKDVNYSYGAGKNGTKGSITEDLDYISKITVKNCFGFGEIVYYTSLVIKIIQITAPIILIIWASIDLFKSMIAGDEKKIVEMRKPIIQRFISAAAIFLVPWLVSTIVNNFSSNADWLVCWKNNRYTYSRTDDDYKGSGYVNSVHDQSKEKKYINYSCTTQCHGKNITNCKELCMNTYWESSINCYDAGIVGKTDTASTEAARTACYDDFAENAILIIKDKNK
ncbi:MAG: hypothetical protein IKZ96_04060 [Bacilli bacterium]|nr:hypothetical protein [Bacilli bacterium]